MRIVTRPDFDGIVCAVIFYETNDITEPVKWIEPIKIQKGQVKIKKGDIISNLPYNKNCSLWFDHHYTNKIDVPFEGSFKIAPSAAGVAYEYFKDKLKKDFSELIREIDKIDSASLTQDEVRNPEKYPYILLSMTIVNRDFKDVDYWNRLVDLLRNYKIDQILEDSEVKKRCDLVIEENEKYKNILENYTTKNKHVSLIDFRTFDEVPNGNRFLSYSLFPDSIVSIKIRFDDFDKKKIILNVGHNIFNNKCNVNIGLLLSEYNGGGHPGAGACCFHVNKAEEYIPKIISILLDNKQNDNND